MIFGGADETTEISVKQIALYKLYFTLFEFMRQLLNAFWIKVVLKTLMRCPANFSDSPILR